MRFHNQIKVVLVASRGEMSSVKADVWWGEKDYHNFRYRRVAVVFAVSVVVLIVAVAIMAAAKPGISDGRLLLFFHGLQWRFFCHASS